MRPDIEDGSCITLAGDAPALVVVEASWDRKEAFAGMTGTGADGDNILVTALSVFLATLVSPAVDAMAGLLACRGKVKEEDVGSVLSVPEVSEEQLLLQPE